MCIRDSHHIEQDEIGFVRRHGDRQGLLAIGGDLRAVSVLENTGDNRNVRRGVIDHQYELAIRTRHDLAPRSIERREAIPERLSSAASNSKLPTCADSVLISRGVRTPVS